MFTEPQDWGWRGRALHRDERRGNREFEVRIFLLFSLSFFFLTRLRERFGFAYIHFWKKFVYAKSLAIPTSCFEIRRRFGEKWKGSLKTSQFHDSKHCRERTASSGAPDIWNFKVVHFLNFCKCINVAFAQMKTSSKIK